MLFTASMVGLLVTIVYLSANLRDYLNLAFFDLKKIYILFIVDYILVPKFVLVDSLKQLAYFC